MTPRSLRHWFAAITLKADAALHYPQDSMTRADHRIARRYDRIRHNLKRSAGHEVAKAPA